MALHFSLSFSITFNYGHNMPFHWQFVCIESNENRHAYCILQKLNQLQVELQEQHHLRFMAVDCLGRTAQAKKCQKPNCWLLELQDLLQVGLDWITCRPKIKEATNCVVIFCWEICDHNFILDCICRSKVYLGNGSCQLQIYHWICCKGAEQ